MAKKRSEDETPEASEEVANKKPLSVHLPADLVERIKNACYWTPGLTVGALAEDALRKAVSKLEAETNHGKPFEARGEAGLRRGRPLK